MVNIEVLFRVRLGVKVTFRWVCQRGMFLPSPVWLRRRNLHKEIVRLGANMVIDDQWEPNEAAFTSWPLCVLFLFGKQGQWRWSEFLVRGFHSCFDSSLKTKKTWCRMKFTSLVMSHQWICWWWKNSFQSPVSSKILWLRIYSLHLNF